MKTKSISIFEFSELSDSAKERARQWFRNSSDDCFWSESAIDDAADLFDLIGVDIRQTLKKRMDNSYHYAPSVFLSGFSSQGDGACFNAKYRYKKGGLKALIAHAPNETALHEIAKQMQDIQKRYFYAIQVSTSHNGWGYSHAYMMNIDVECENGIGEAAENDISECLRDLANWLYRALEREYDYQNSDDVVDESISCNEYEFLESGVAA